MDGFSSNLILAAAGVALIHTALGPDHYLPFIMLGRARGWSASRAAAITAACGAGHVVSSLALGGVGVALGVAVARLDRLESARGSLAAWMLVAFGLAYGLWGARRALRRRRGLQPHVHDGHVHMHRQGQAPHDHDARVAGDSAVPFWTLFAVFVLGPCEPLIPLFVLPASRGRWGLAIATAAVFAAVTVAAMVALALIGLVGLRPVRLAPLERWSHAMAGGVIACSGLAIIFLGL